MVPEGPPTEITIVLFGPSVPVTKDVVEVCVTPFCVVVTVKLSGFPFSALNWTVTGSVVPAVPEGLVREISVVQPPLTAR